MLSDVNKKEKCSARAGIVKFISISGEIIIYVE